jgi:hypothetical protein
MSGYLKYILFELTNSFIFCNTKLIAMDIITDNLKEIIIAVISFLGGMTTQFYINKKKKSIRMHQHAGDNSNQYQSGRDMNVNR